MSLNHHFNKTLAEKSRERVVAKTALNSGGIASMKLGTRRKAGAWLVVLVFWIPFSGNAVSGGKGESFLQLRWQKAGCLLTDCSKKAVSATPWAVVAIVATATPNIYFKPRAISTHSLYMLLVAFFHTQEARDVGREPATKAQSRRRARRRRSQASSTALIFRAWLYFLLFLLCSVCAVEVEKCNLTSRVCG